MSPDVVTPPCDADAAPLPPKGARVRWLASRAVPSFGVVHDTDPQYGRLLVLRDGAMFSAWFHTSDWEVVP